MSLHVVDHQQVMGSDVIVLTITSANLDHRCPIIEKNNLKFTRILGYLFSYINTRCANEHFVR